MGIVAAVRAIERSKEQSQLLSTENCTGARGFWHENHKKHNVLWTETVVQFRCCSQMVTCSCTWSDFLMVHFVTAISLTYHVATISLYVICNYRFVWHPFERRQVFSGRNRQIWSPSWWAFQVWMSFVGVGPRRIPDSNGITLNEMTLDARTNKKLNKSSIFEWRKVIWNCIPIKLKINCLVWTHPHRISGSPVWPRFGLRAYRTCACTWACNRYCMYK